MPSSPRACRLAVTLGDPAGIGPEIVVKALASADLPDADIVVVGCRAHLERAEAILAEIGAEWGLTRARELLKQIA